MTGEYSVPLQQASHKVTGPASRVVVMWGRLQKGVRHVRTDMRTNANWKNNRFVQCYVTFLYRQLSEAVNWQLDLKTTFGNTFFWILFVLID